MSNAVDILTQGGFQNADAIVRAANDTGLPLGIAVALIAKESYGANVYGHDAGGAMSGAGAVTEDNFKNQFLPLIKAGHTSNGVGPTQITYAGYFTQNPDIAWWDPYSNMVFGFNLMKGYLGGNYSVSNLIAAGSKYNSGTATGAPQYGKTFDQLATTWTNRLSNSDTNVSAQAQEEDVAISDDDVRRIADEVFHRNFNRQGGPTGQLNLEVLVEWWDCWNNTLAAKIDAVPNDLLNRNVPREGWSEGSGFYNTTTNLAAVLSWFDINVHGIVDTVTSSVTEALSKVTTAGVDEVKVAEIIKTALEASLSGALSNAAKGVNSTNDTK